MENKSTGTNTGESLNFSWRMGDYALNAVPRRLVHFTGNEPNETIDFVKYYRTSEGRELCYSIGYFYWNEHEPCWELKFVGDRFKEIQDTDIVTVFQMLGSAYDALAKWKDSQNHDF